MATHHIVFFLFFFSKERRQFRRRSRQEVRECECEREAAPVVPGCPRAYLVRVAGVGAGRRLGAGGGGCVRVGVGVGVGWGRHVEEGGREPAVYTHLSAR